MSGTGKSTVLTALAARGFATVDTDDGWCEFAADGEWVWREDRIGELLVVENAAPLFVAGCARNQVKFYRRFDHIVLLSAPQETLLDRLAGRTTNPFGKRPEQRARILADLTDIEPRLRRSATLEIDTRAPLAAVVDQLAQLVERGGIRSA